MTTDKQLTVQAAAKDGHYQIVCRHQFAAMNSWYITLTDVDDWDWNVNEYRIFVGTREPPMINEMNDYSVYFCGYTYFFIDNDDGQVKRVTNVNFTEFGEQYTSFLKCEKIQVDKVYSNETGKVTVEDSLSINKGLDVNDDVTAKANVDVSKNLSTSGNLNVSGESQFSKKVVMDSNLQVNSDFYLSGEFYNTNNMRVTGDASIDTSLKTPVIYVNNISRISGSDGVVFNDSIQVENNLTAKADVNVSKNLNVSTDTNLQGKLEVSSQSNFKDNATFNKDLTVDGFINGIKIRII